MHHLTHRRFKLNARLYLWQGWDKATYRERLKQSYPEVTSLFGSISEAPPGTTESRATRTRLK